MDGRLVLRDREVFMLGVDYGGGGKILAENKGYVVVKWPGHMGWYAIGVSKYYPGEICVYRKEEGLIGKREVVVDEVISWSTKRGGGGR